MAWSSHGLGIYGPGHFEQAGASLLPVEEGSQEGVEGSEWEATVEDESAAWTLGQVVSARQVDISSGLYVDRGSLELYTTVITLVDINRIEDFCTYPLQIQD